MRGEITPDQAEAEAATIGLPPFACTPDPTRFAPMNEVWWTLGMAAAWIIWRTPTAVRNVWSEYRREVREWRSPFYHRLHESGYGYRQPVAISEDGGPIKNTVPGTIVVKEYRLERLRELSLFDVFARQAYKMT